MIADLRPRAAGGGKGDCRFKAAGRGVVAGVIADLRPRGVAGVIADLRFGPRGWQG